MGYLNTTTALPSTISTSCEVPSTRWTTSCRGLKKDLRPLRRILTHRPQHRKQKQKPWAPQPQQTEHVGMLARNNIRCECHVGIPSGHRQRDRPNRRKERKCVICSGPHWASQCPENQGKLGEKNGETIARTAYNEFAVAVHTETSMFAREALETGEALIDCGATRSMESWGGTGRSGTHECATSRSCAVFFPDRTKKTWYTLANRAKDRSHSR